LYILLISKLPKLILSLFLVCKDTYNYFYYANLILIFFGIVNLGLRFATLTANGLRLGVVAVFTTNVDTKHTLQIYEKLSYEALHPPLRQTAVIGCLSLSFVK